MARRRRGDKARVPGTRRIQRPLTNTLLHQPAFSEDRLVSLHQTALRVLRELGIRVLNDEARALFSSAGATVQGDMVHIDAELVESALQTAPSTITLAGASSSTDVTLGGDNTAFVCVGGPPHFSDLDRGKRNGSLEDCQNLIRLSEHYDVLHVLSPNVEPVDVALEVRHLHTIHSQLTLGSKPFFIYSRGTGQVEDGFALAKIARGISQQEFEQRPWCYTVINTNSPRQLDIPMCQGIIDFARAGQMSVITPFTLAGAMAPVTMTGALVLQHAEALAGITLAQLVRPGAPVMYGSFTSNVDMKSGSPAFGTPEFVKAAFGAGQLARHIGLPWRGSAATASNIADEQSMYEFVMSAWGSILGGVNMLVHAAGWLEGGLTASIEKFILDIEVLQMFAGVFEPLGATDEDLAFEAIASVEPGGHFFGCEHTMARYREAFYEPLVSDWSNYGQWEEAGGLRAVERANRIWKQALKDYQQPVLDESVHEALNDYIARRTAAGGELPWS